jgi:hypothetical protein
MFNVQTSKFPAALCVQNLNGCSLILQTFRKKNYIFSVLCNIEIQTKNNLKDNKIFYIYTKSNFYKWQLTVIILLWNAKYCDMSNRCWATGGGTSYHENRTLINGRLPSYATIRKAVFLHVVPRRAKVRQVEPKHAGYYAAKKNSWQRCPATSANTAITQQGSEACFPLSGWGFIRELECQRSQ